MENSDIFSSQKWPERPVTSPFATSSITLFVQQEMVLSTMHVLFFSTFVIRLQYSELELFPAKEPLVGLV